MNIKKFLFSLCGLFLIPVVAFAQVTQDATLTIFPGSIFIVNSPDDFSFGTLFIGAATTETYQTLDPSFNSSLLAVEDADLTGADFFVNMAMSNFVNGGNVLPFTDFSMVTLANDASGVDIYTPSSPPAATVGVTAPLDCSAWAGDLETDCDLTLDSQPFTDSSVFHAADPTSAIASGGQSNIPVLDESVYTVNEIIEFASGEKALVVDIPAGLPDEIIVTREILGTPDSSQGAGSGITSFGANSIQEVIMDGPEPITGRFGSYAVGFGFKGNIQPYYEAGSYSGTIFFDLIVI